MPKAWLFRVPSAMRLRTLEEVLNKPDHKADSQSRGKHDQCGVEGNSLAKRQEGTEGCHDKQPVQNFNSPMPLVTGVLNDTTQQVADERPPERSQRGCENITCKAGRVPLGMLLSQEETNKPDSQAPHDSSVHLRRL